MGRSNDVETYNRHRKNDDNKKYKDKVKSSSFCACAREGCNGWRDTKKMFEDENVRCYLCHDLFPSYYIPGPLKAKWATLEEQDKKKNKTPPPKDDAADKVPKPEDAAATAADKDKHAKLKEELEKVTVLAEISPNLAASLKSRAEEIQKEIDELPADADDSPPKTVVQQKRLLDKRTLKKKQLADKVTAQQKLLEKLLQEVEDQKALIAKDEELFEEAAKLEAEAAEKHTNMPQDEQTKLKQDKKGAAADSDTIRGRPRKTNVPEEADEEDEADQDEREAQLHKELEAIKKAKQRRKEQRDLQASSAAGSQAVKGVVTRTRSPEAVPDQDKDKRRKNDEEEVDEVPDMED